MSNKPHRRHHGDFTWEEVPVLASTQDGTAPVRDVTRQVLFADADLGCQLRYFEVAPGGHSTLERHEHVHAVMIVRGAGRALVGEQVMSVALNDLVHVPALSWHQFRADADTPLGFLCMVNAQRDRPQLPDATALAQLRAQPEVGEFIRV